MNKIEMLEIEIKDLENAYDDVCRAINNLNDVEGLDEEYKMLDEIAGSIDDYISDKRIELSNLEEEQEYEENKGQWEAEIKQQNADFDKMRL